MLDITCAKKKKKLRKKEETIQKCKYKHTKKVIPYPLDRLICCLNQSKTEIDIYFYNHYFCQNNVKYPRPTKLMS